LHEGSPATPISLVGEGVLEVEADDRPFLQGAEPTLIHGDELFRLFWDVGVHHREDGVPMSKDLVVVGELIAVEFHCGGGARKGRWEGVFSGEEEVGALIVLQAARSWGK
jgi:hypothetical protein